MVRFAYASPFGVVQLWGREGKLCRVVLGSAPTSAIKEGEPGFLKPFVELLDCYFQGREIQCDGDSLQWDGLSGFRRRVYEELLDVEFGQVITYRRLAERCGHPHAARAAGSALRLNPLPIFVPCHRVVGAQGRLGGFSAGLGWKRNLLAHEGWCVQGDRLAHRRMAEHVREVLPK